MSIGLLIPLYTHISEKPMIKDLLFDHSMALPLMYLLTLATLSRNPWKNFVLNFPNFVPTKI